MLSAEDRERIAAQRRGFAEWLAGDQTAPFVIERCRSCNTSVDPVFWPTARSRLALLFHPFVRRFVR